VPTGYGDHHIVLMVKDPWWIYAYWEIQPQQERQAHAQLSPDEVGGLQTILRVYDITQRNFPAQPAHRFMDIPLSSLANNWYIHVDAPDRTFVVDIGLLTRQGRFLLLARSNPVHTPRFGPSDVLDEEWMVPDELYWKLFGLTAGVGGSSGPLGAKELLERARGSPGLFSPGFANVGQAQVARGFWLAVHTDVVVHGATAPKSTVTIEGQAVRVRPDGTFSLRMTMDNGAHTVPVQATSPDGRHTAQVAAVVSHAHSGAAAISTPAGADTSSPATPPRTTRKKVR
jgi:hypothetical protein